MKVKKKSVCVCICLPLGCWGNPQGNATTFEIARYDPDQFCHKTSKGLWKPTNKCIIPRKDIKESIFPLVSFPNVYRHTDLSYNTRKRKHNSSLFEIAVWQPAITLQIPDQRSNHGNSFQNTPAAYGGKKGLFCAPYSPQLAPVFTLQMEWNPWRRQGYLLWRT